MPVTPTRTFIPPEPKSQPNFQLWEDEDPLQLPDMDLQGPMQALPDVAPAPEAPRSWNRQSYDDVMDKYDTHLSAQPRLSDEKYKPGWARKIAAIATGALGGYTGQDVSGAVSEYARPGYRRDVQDWTNQDSAMRQKVGMAGKRVEAELDTQRAATEARRASAYERGQSAAESLARAREAALDKPKLLPPVGVGPGGLYDPNAGKLVVPPRPANPPAPPARSVLLSPEVEAQSIRIARESRPERAGPQVTPGQKVSIEARKGARIATHKIDYDKKLAVLDADLKENPNDGGQYSQSRIALADWDQQVKQQIQDDYEKEITALGGEITQPFRYDRSVAPPAGPGLGARKADPAGIR